MVDGNVENILTYSSRHDFLAALKIPKHHRDALRYAAMTARGGKEEKTRMSTKTDHGQ